MGCGNYLPHESEEPWPTKAYNNATFLNGSASRLLRVQCELLEPEQRFRQQKVHNTIVFFGSARTLPPADAREALEAAEAALAANANPEASVTLEAALTQARLREKTSAYYQHAVDLARELTQWSLKHHASSEQRFHICSGGGPGIMQAANQGAQEAGGKSIGLGISLPFEQHSNPYISDELDFEFHYFFVRKYWFLYPAKALVIFPGGFGTMDELFEMMTLVQTGKIRKRMPTVLFGSEFWDNLIHWDTFLEWGMISEKDLELFRVMDDVGEARDWLTAQIQETLDMNGPMIAPAVP
ncbi:MAG: TIGR00730 family Rossman fold protein [Opitutales bacterium]